MECPITNIPLQSESSFPFTSPFTHIKLEPFAHQVGGHSSMLCLDRKTVCKPLISQECQFYETLPPELLPFTAAYRGLVAVQCSLSPDRDDSGYITLTAYPPPWYKGKIPSPFLPTKRRIKFRRGGSIEIESDTDELFDDDSINQEILSPLDPATLSSSPPWPIFPSSESNEIRRPSLGHNPWILHCHRDHLTRLFGQDPSTSPPRAFQAQEFLLLENLIWRCKRPCVLDLKMGLQQFGDDASPTKRLSQTTKAANSTTNFLGARICGMQVFQVTTGRFLCRNKYFGRSLSADGFREALKQFLHNGNTFRRDVLPPLVEKLRQVQKTLQDLPGFRFYTSSLLIIYDGYVPGGGDSPESVTPPEESDGFGPEATPMSAKDASGVYTDVRIIDFAHATHPNLPNKQRIHCGPDQGFLFGLENLLNILNDF